METAIRVEPNEIFVQEARRALLAAGWLPLTTIRSSEHWTRAGQHCILQCDSSLDFSEINCDKTRLESASYVHFVCLPGGTLITQ